VTNLATERKLSVELHPSDLTQAMWVCAALLLRV